MPKLGLTNHMFLRLTGPHWQTLQKLTLGSSIEHTFMKLMPYVLLLLLFFVAPQFRNLPCNDEANRRRRRHVTTWRFAPLGSVSEEP